MYVIIVLCCVCVVTVVILFLSCLHIPHLVTLMIIVHTFERNFQSIEYRIIGTRI